MRQLCSVLLLAWLCLPTHAVADTGESMPASHYTASLLTFINNYRLQHGMRPLTPASQLAAIAREHSLYMAEHGDISHDGFDRRFDRSRRANCVENVGWNYRDPFDQFKGWQRSSGHDAAMLDPTLTVGGVAVFDAYVTFFACS